jgi:hypothetical protein
MQTPKLSGIYRSSQGLVEAWKGDTETESHPEELETLPISHPALSHVSSIIPGAAGCFAATHGAGAEVDVNVQIGYIMALRTYAARIDDGWSIANKTLQMLLDAGCWMLDAGVDSRSVLLYIGTQVGPAGSPPSSV